MFLKAQLNALCPQKDEVDLNGTNMYLFLVDKVQIISNGYYDCTF